MTEECPYPGIPAYLNKEPKETLQIPNAKVTHICCTGESEFTAEHVALCSKIDHVVSKPEDMIGKVDAVIIATDIGSEHVRRARPFIEAGIPVFIDKPMVDNVEDLRTFDAWMEEGKPILSSSSMRYTKEFLPYRLSTNNLGNIRYASIASCKYWKTYGIHALEGIYPILGPGFLTAQNIGHDESKNLVHFTHQSGADVIVASVFDMFGSFGALNLYGTAGSAQVRSADSFYSFKKQLESFIDWLRTGVRPFPYSETHELMQMVIAGTLSKEQGGKIIRLEDIR